MKHSSPYSKPSPEYYEAATIDGATKPAQFRYMTLPLLKGVFKTNITMWSVSSVGFFVWSQLFSTVTADMYEEEGQYFYEDKSDKIIDDDTLARLLSFNNVIVTSHQAFFTKEAMANIAHTTLQNVKDFAEGRPLVNEVVAS